MIPRLIPFGILAAAITFTHTAEADQTTSENGAAQQVKRGADDEGAEWSEAVAGLQARIVLRHSEVLNGTPILATYLHLRNLANSPMKLAWSTAQVEFRVVDAAGRQLPMGGMSYDGPAAIKADLVIPNRGTLSFDISQQGCGIPGNMAALIDLGPDDSFFIGPNDGACTLHAVLEIEDSRQKQPPGADAERDPTWAWHGRIELPPVPIPLTVEQPDPTTTDELIRQFGLAMLGNDGHKSEEAKRALSLIADERVVPWYIKALDTNNYDLKFAALDRLSRFEGDAAFHALKKGMSTQAKDIGNCSTEDVARQLAKNVRHSAAGALARSPHPEAQPFLLTMWNDPSREVRMTLLHVLGKSNTDESRALLKKMSEDSDQGVRDEASRYLKLREAGSN